MWREGASAPFPASRRIVRWVAVVVALALTSCGSGKKVSEFAGTTPAFDPLNYFTGHVASWGVIERFGTPTDVVTTDCTGTVEPDGSLHMVQTLDIGGEHSHREWHMRRIGAARQGVVQYEATANDMVGTAHGEASGRAFHWTWTLALKPGNSLFDVTMDQWWFAFDDGTMLNRTGITKLGLTVAEVTERFEPVR